VARSTGLAPKPTIFSHQHGESMAAKSSYIVPCLQFPNADIDYRGLLGLCTHFFNTNIVTFSCPISRADQTDPLEKGMRPKGSFYIAHPKSANRFNNVSTFPGARLFHLRQSGYYQLLELIDSSLNISISLASYNRPQAAVSQLQGHWKNRRLSSSTKTAHLCERVIAGRVYIVSSVIRTESSSIHRSRNPHR